LIPTDIRLMAQCRRWFLRQPRKETTPARRVSILQELKEAIHRFLDRTNAALYLDLSEQISSPPSNESTKRLIQTARM
jgi:hypothetical protein